MINNEIIYEINRSEDEEKIIAAWASASMWVCKCENDDRRQKETLNIDIISGNVTLEISRQFKV